MSCHQSHCRSCGRPILWARTDGRKIPSPFDPEPVPTGKYEIKDGQATYRVGLSNLHQSHFASCKQADSWRKGKKKEEGE